MIGIRMPVANLLYCTHTHTHTHTHNKEVSKLRGILVSKLVSISVSKLLIILVNILRGVTMPVAS